jgi:hypothetical protein
MTQLPSAGEMMDAARAATGLGDFGDDLFREPFEVLISDLNSEARLTDIGAERAYRRLFETLCQRLKVTEDRKRFPAIADEEITAPIFVAGLPRSGTTFFHSLLSADPDNRSPATWEIMFPSPPPQADTHGADPRIADAERALEFEGFMGKALQAVHPFDARRPEECNFLWELSFLSVNYSAWWNAPNYTALFYRIDPALIYQEEKRLLQHLQHRFKRSRWVLKTPAHNRSLPELFSVFPDASVVQCHRDPARILASLSKNLAIWRAVFSNHVAPGAFGMLELQAESLAKMAVFRARPEFAGRFFDAHYMAVQADPVGELSRCYRQFRVPFDERRASEIRNWLDTDRASHAQGPRHTYNLDDYGLDDAAVDRVLGSYIRQYEVQLER